MPSNQERDQTLFYSFQDLHINAQMLTVVDKEVWNKGQQNCKRWGLGHSLLPRIVKKILCKKCSFVQNFHLFQDASSQ